LVIPEEVKQVEEVDVIEEKVEPISEKISAKTPDKIRGPGDEIEEDTEVESGVMLSADIGDKKKSFNNRRTKTPNSSERKSYGLSS
jgi:hypothetical protein